MKAEDSKLIDDGKVMSLLGHLAELRYRLVISVFAIFIAFCVTFFFASQIILFLRQPLMAALPQGNGGLHFTGPLDVFMSQIKVSFLCAVIFACPIWLNQFWRFIEPAMYQHERRMILPFTVMSVVLFCFGIFFSYYLVLPMALDFLIKLGLEVGSPIIAINDYISILTVTIFGFGIVFETPLVLVLLGTLGVLTAEMLRKARRYVIVGSLVLAALIVPPDPLSQVGMAIPLYLMYEISILIIALIEKKKKR